MASLKNMRFPLLLVLACGLSGCVVYADPPPRRVVYVERSAPPPPPAPAVVVTEDDEVHYVVYREYFGCTDEEIYLLPHYRRYYSLSDDDIYFIYFCSRRSNVSFDACFHSYYYDCGRSYDRLVVTYNVPREHFFVSVGVGVTSYPPVYQRTYVSYQNGTYVSATYTNTEYVALVQMRVAVDYQGHPPATYFARVQATGSPSKVIVQSRAQCGQGGQTAVGAKVSVIAPRPWTMPPQQKQQWHQEHQEKATKSEVAFKEVHKEQVQKVQTTEKAQAGKNQGRPNGAASKASSEEKGAAGAEKSGTDREKGGAAKTPAGEHSGPKEGNPRAKPAGEARAAGEKTPPAEKRPPPPPKKKEAQEEDREKKGKDK